MIVYKWFCCFVILLVISITPVSAIETANAMDMTRSKTTEKTLDTFNNDMDHLQTVLDNAKIHMDRIKEDQDYIGNNWYKFWKWGKVSSSIDDINDQLEEMKTSVDDLETSSKSISSDLDALKTINSSLNSSSNDESYDGDGYSSAESIALLLKAKNISVEISNPTNFKEGDIVQYHDEGKYYRYLQYNGIDNKTNYVKLQNRNRNIMVSQEKFNQTATLKISSTDNKQLLTPVYQVLDFQLKTLDKNYNETLNSSQNLDKNLSQISELIVYLLAGGGIGFVVLALISALTSWKVLYIYTISALSFIEMMSICGLVLSVIKDKTDKSLHDLYEEKTDLYECIHGDPHSYPVAEDYNLTTPVNKALSGQIECREYDYVFDHFVEYSMIKAPEHGSLNLSEHGLYTYTPDAYFTGTDSFKYRVNDGLVDSNIAEVHINITKNSTHMTIWKADITTDLDLVATLTDDNGLPIANKTVQFICNGTNLGNATTNKDGRAFLTMDYLPIYSQLSFLAVFLEDSMYTGSNASTDSENLTVS